MVSDEVLLEKSPFAQSDLRVAFYLKSADRFASARERYRPDAVRVLFIAESPPSSGGYFYFTTTVGKDHLFRETMKALQLWPMKRPMRKGLDKRPLLDEFQRMKYFLIDTCNRPVDKLSHKLKTKHVARGASSLGSRIKNLDPKTIIIVKKTVFRPVRDAMGKAGLGDRVLNEKPIPFPSHGNQRKYRATLRRLIHNAEGIQS